MVRRTAAEESWYRELAILRGELSALDADIAAARAMSKARPRNPLSFKHDDPPPLRMSGEHVKLSDGTEIVIRPIEPDDAGELQRGLEHLSAMSAFKSFREHITRVTSQELDYLTRVDHCRHEALVAIYPPDHEGIGVARYVCDPADHAQAVVTYVITDAWQERGVGSALLERLAARARASGVERFVATMIVGDARSHRLLERVAEPTSERVRNGIVEITARLRS
jgi:acetyltransferase